MFKVNETSYMSCYSVDGTRKTKTLRTEQSAFEVYVKYHEAGLRLWAEKLKPILTDNVYQALIDWRVTHNG